MTAPTRFVRPIVLVSKCLSGAACLPDGGTVDCPFVRMLRRYANVVSVCPELEIGLGVPREETILVQASSGTTRLYQRGRKVDLSHRMMTFSRRYVNSLDRIDGILLKSKSATCGPRAVRIYDSYQGGRTITRNGRGLFADELIRQFPGLPVEDERRLDDHRIREHWLTRLFVLAALHQALRRGTLGSISSFFNRHRVLLETYSRRATSELAGLIEQFDSNRNDSSSIAKQVYRLMARPPRRRSALEPLLKARDHYRRELARADIRLFDRQASCYLDGDLPLAVLRKTVQVWAVRYDKAFVRSDAVYRPYPNALA